MSGDHTSGLPFLQTLIMAVVTGLVSLVLAIVGAFLTVLRARSDFNREIDKIKAQIAEQKKAERLGRIAELRQQFLTPLRYYAHILSNRFAELEEKFHSGDIARAKGWFKVIKDHVTRDNRKSDYAIWCFYEGIF